MASQEPNQEQEVPKTSFVLDLDQELQCLALVEALDLVLDRAPVVLQRAGELRAFRAQLLVRLSYLLMHCSVRSSDHLRAELHRSGMRAQVLGQRLLAQERDLELLRRRSPSLTL